MRRFVDEAEDIVGPNPNRSSNEFGRLLAFHESLGKSRERSHSKDNNQLEEPDEISTRPARKWCPVLWGASLLPGPAVAVLFLWLFFRSAGETPKKLRDDAPPSRLCWCVPVRSLKSRQSLPVVHRTGLKFYDTVR